MIDRLIHEDWQLIFPLVALIVAALVYAAAAWRTGGLKPAATERLARSRSDAE